MPSRYVCTVLDEMRTHIKKVQEHLMGSIDEPLIPRFKYLEVLIEEVQTLVNRMESALAEDWAEELNHERQRKLKVDRRKLEKEIGALEIIRDELKEMTGE